MHPFPRAAAELDRWFESLLGRQDLKIFAIKSKEGEYWGNIELRDIDWIAGRAEVGIFLAEPEAQGLGLGREAIQAIARFAFEDLRLHRLYAKILESNTNAQRSFSRCGFQLEGRERQAFYDQGRHWDVLNYARLKEDPVDATH